MEEVEATVDPFTSFERAVVLEEEAFDDVCAVDLSENIAAPMRRDPTN
jgi:hypothetical protein